MTDTLSPPLPTPGASPRGGGRVNFSLFAPGKGRVGVIGDFNGWEAGADPLQLTEDGWWWLEREVGAGEHRYQFVVDGVTVVDPYAREVVSVEGQALPHAVVRVDEPGYAWEHDGFRRPAWRDLVIYELHVADFTAEGTLTAATARLDALRELGVNAIELLPIAANALAEGWGYQPVYPFAVRPAYGDADDLKRFVDEAHARGIAVILDVVLAHTAEDCPLNKLYPYEESPWYGEGIGGGNEFGLPTLDHRKPATQALTHELQRYWLSEFHLDGLRYDFAVNIGKDDAGNGLPRLARDARAIREGVYLVGEYVPEDPGAIDPSGIDAIWHVRASVALKAMAMQQDYLFRKWSEFETLARFIDPAHEDYAAASQMVNYLESHDEERLVHELRAAGATGLAARQRMALAATALLTAPGVPMLYMGQEFGEDTHRAVNERNPLRWDLLATEGGRWLLDHYRKLVAFRREHAALRGEHVKIEALNSDEKWFVFHRWEEAGDDVVVAANFGDGPRRVTAPLADGKWRDLFTGRVVEGGALDVELPPSEAMVLCRV